MPKIGLKLRKLRNRRRLSIRELAGRTGIAHSTISLIERDKISPSLDTLAAIIDALGTTLSNFFGTVDASFVRPFYGEGDFVEIGTLSEISYRMVGINFPERQMLVLKETYQPGAISEVDLTHEAQEAGIVLEGEVKVTVAGIERVLRAGEAYYFDSKLPHTFENVSDHEAVIFSAITPPSY